MRILGWKHTLLPFLFALSSPALSYQGSEPIADGTLYQDDFGDIANGSGAYAFVGDNSSGEIRRTVMKFDFPGLPPGTPVADVTLEITVVQMSPTGPTNRPLDLHRMLGDWSEGDSDAGSPGGNGTDTELGDATWIHSSFPGSLWVTPGGDFAPQVSATRSITSTSQYLFSSQTMRADVQAWVDNPSQNFGWLLKMNDEISNSAIRLATRENSTISIRPRLYLDLNIFTSFCSPADTNSTGLPTRLIGGFGFGVGSGLHLEGYDGPPGQFGYILVGTGSSEPGISLGSGHLCLATSGSNQLGRYNVTGGVHNSIGIFDATGRLINGVGTSTSGTGFDVPSTVPIPGLPTIMAGDVWHFQLWHRETNSGSNLSNGLSVRF